MAYKVINPLGLKHGYGHGTHSGFSDYVKYDSIGAAVRANDLVLTNLVENEGGVIYFEGWHTIVPDRKLYRQLTNQDLSNGVSEEDEKIAQKLATELFDSI